MKMRRYWRTNRRFSVKNVIYKIIILTSTTCFTLVSVEEGGVGIEVSYFPFDNKLHNVIKLAKRIRKLGVFYRIL